MTAPTLVELFQALQGGPLPDELRRRVDAAGEEGRARLRLAASLLAALEKGPLPEVPSRLRRLALEAGPGSEDGARGPLERAADRVQEWVARLVPPPALAPATLRGPAPVAHRLYEAGAYEVDLEWLDGETLVGQVAPVAPDVAATEALRDAFCVLCGEREVRQTPVEENGDFRFTALRPGPFTLTIESPSLRIVLPDPPPPGTE